MAPSRRANYYRPALEVTTSFRVAVLALAVAFLLAYLLRRWSRLDQQRKARDAAGRRTELEGPPKT